MEKTLKKGLLVGYQIGDHVEIHKHINHPGEWMLTIRSMGIISQLLCDIDCDEEEIARYVYAELRAKLSTTNELIRQVFPFT